MPTRLEELELMTLVIGELLNEYKDELEIVKDEDRAISLECVIFELESRLVTTQLEMMKVQSRQVSDEPVN